MKKITLTLLAVSTFMLSCTKDDDNNEDLTKPQAALILPIEDETVNVGDSLFISGTLTDNEGLAQATMELHPAGDGHGHKTIAEEWEWDTLMTLSGKEATFSFYKVIPAAADSGLYHFTLASLDKAGNKGNTISLDIHIHP